MYLMRSAPACVFPPFRRTVGSSIDSECAFEGDYDVPPLSMAEGLQHMRIMEGVSRSLPSSPLLAHQTVNVRLQPVKKISTGSATGMYLIFSTVCLHRYVRDEGTLVLLQLLVAALSCCLFA